MGLLDGKVVLITGAGAGLGRAYAVACAREGARVVVNDLGGARDGQGSSADPADTVVREIAALGGEAVANHDSVADPAGCARMVAAAVDRWGRLDAVVNNAGILRDGLFREQSDDAWSAVIDVHLNGTRHVTKAAVPALMRQGGAIVNTSSYSGLVGNFNQSNYAAAKAGIYGFTRVLAVELGKYGITANCLAPVAKTRMTDEIGRIESEWTAEQVAPLVVFLASDLARGVTGKVFGVQGQRIHAYAIQINEGVEKPGDAPWTPHEIAERLGDILSFAEPEPATSGDDVVDRVFAGFPLGFRPDAAKGWAANIQWRVRGGAHQTVQVADGVCIARAGLHGEPTCTVKLGRDTLLDLFAGKLDMGRAFLLGKATADNMGDLFKMGAAFDFDRIARAFEESR